MDEIKIFNKKEIQEGNISYCSFPMNTIEEKKKAFSIISNPEKRLSDMINKKIRMKDLFAEQVEITDENTGEIINTVRMVIVDDKGVGYACVSKGVFNSMSRLIGLIGHPSEWKEPLTIEIKSKQIGKNNSCLVFDIA